MNCILTANETSSTKEKAYDYTNWDFLDYVMA